ncbi:MAG: M3 family oligoendopeptidase [Proteobacteria bacterium]|nr:M3 family oligoendopeptidase [Pseudomonadota bacterium]MCP4918439.1 M3 family oligoendopeptidase [Pseudomonadota bacterium]
MRLSELSVDRPELIDLKTEATDLLARFDAADDTAGRAQVIEAWDASRTVFDTHRNLAGIRFSQDTRDADRKADKTHFDTIGPDVRELDVALLKKAMDHRDDLAAELGDHALSVWACNLESFDPKLADGMRKESEFETKYDEVRAAMKADFRGEKLTLMALRAFYGDADRTTRLESRQAQDALLGAHADTLDSLFDEQVAVRHKMARDLGEETFTPLAYRRLARTDYGPDEVARFRQAIQDRIVPLASAIRARHAQALGVSDYAFHDTTVRDLKGVPKPDGDHDWMIGRARTMFDRMGPDFADFFERMLAGELLDLKVREGKTGGGYCESLNAYGMPFIFANFNGTQDDVNVFTHECGHAFQCFTTMQSKPRLRDYVWPTYEACEIHSMGLEMLTYPEMELFFGDDAERFRTGHIESSLLFLPYGATVDAFQHEVYANPDWTPDRRASAWSDLEKTFLPEWVYDDMPNFESGRFWQRQGHLYGVPFYYIDYCLAQTCAFQLWRRHRQDPKGTMALYRRLCELGGHLPFRSILKEVGLEDPFEGDTLARVADDVADVLGL